MEWTNLRGKLELLVERSFAYELYHQLRLLIDRYNAISNHPILFIHGEISKKWYKKEERVFPDIVIHGDPSSKENQIMVCEIKRKNALTKKAIYEDLEALCISKDEFHFNLAVFIAVGIIEADLKSKLQESISEWKDKANYMDTAKKICVISYGKEDGKNYQLRKFKIGDLFKDPR